MKLSTLSFVLLSVASYISFGTAAGENSFQLALDYHVPKNIAFSCHFGGSSHIVWVLSILEELAARGHHTTFYTRVMSLYDTKNSLNVYIFLYPRMTV
jgi:hypothetical protein